MKVLYITNIPNPYRVEFWNELGKHCDLTVWFESVKEKNRDWHVKGLGQNFKYKFLKGVTFGTEHHFNPTIIRELKKSQFDVYILGCYSSPTEMLAIHWLKKNNIRFILNSDGGFPNKSESKLKRKFKTYFISSATIWLSSGLNCTEYLKYYKAKEQYIYEYPFTSINDVKDFIELSYKGNFHSLKVKEGLKDKVILGIGSFIHRKGFDILIKAFSCFKNDNVSLLLIGGGEEKEKYNELINEYGIKNVVIKDFIQVDQLDNYWRIADLFILPTREDVWGLVINEAISYGLPVITTKNAGAAYSLIQQDQNGFIIDSENHKEIYKYASYLLDNQNVRNNFSKKSLEIAKGYTIREMANTHMEILEKYVSQKL